jgi:hypothetical protein
MDYLRSFVLAVFSIVFVFPLTNCAADIAVGGTGSSNAATRVLVMGEDSNPSSVARGSNIFKRVLGELKNSMLRKGYTIVDEEMIAATLEWEVTDRRPKTELIQVAKFANESDDASLRTRVMAVFSIYATFKELKFTQKVNTRLEGELYDSVSNKFLGSFELPKASYPAPKNCNDICMNEVVGEKAREIATSLGDVLAKKLKKMEKKSRGSGFGAGSSNLKTTYTLTLKHFSTKESFMFMKGLKNAPGYSSHETMSKTSAVRKYSYETASSISDLEESILENLMELEFDLDNDVDINITGTKIILENLRME